MGIETTKPKNASVQPLSTLRAAILKIPKCKGDFTNYACASFLSFSSGVVGSINGHTIAPIR
jgi:hypothetical protein